MLIGIDIGGTKCAVIRAGNDGTILDRTAFATADCESTMERFADAIEQFGKPDAIGISCGGPLDETRGLILSPPNLIGWDNVPVTEILSSRFGCPAALCNDANACALAEWQYGAGRGTRNMIFLTFGTGLGAGLNLDGQLYSGTDGNAGETGHIRLAEFGPVGYGKAGSFEGFCSGGGIRQTAQTLALELLQTGKGCAYCPTVQDLDSVTARSVAEAARAGDETAVRVYELVGEKLGTGLSVLIDLLNPERIVIGSIFERSGDLMRKSMEAVIERETLPAARAVCRVVPAELGDRIGDYAAVAVAAGALEKGQT